MKGGLCAEQGSCLDPSGALELSWARSQGQYVKSHEELVQQHPHIYHKHHSTNPDHHSVLYFITVGAITESGGRYCSIFHLPIYLYLHKGGFIFVFVCWGGGWGAYECAFFQKEKKS